jgi:hypothetical protein
MQGEFAGSFYGPSKRLSKRKPRRQLGFSQRAKTHLDTLEGVWYNETTLPLVVEGSSGQANFALPF